MTRFEKEVYAVVSRIPKGCVLSYKEVASRAGSPGAARAVGTLMARNPFPKHEVPCHRVVRADGRVGSYSGEGGAKAKEKLLQEEGVRIKNKRVVAF